MKRAASPKILFRKEPPASVAWGLHASPAGKLLIGVTAERTVCRIAFAPDGKTETMLKKWKKQWPETSFTRAEKETAAIAKTIASGGAPSSLYMAGTPFQQKVWQALLTIPPGKTLSYGELAKRIKKPKAARAVGAACGANPLAFTVPCHRVVAGNGGLGGFTGGLAIKKKLLKAENRRKKA